MDFYFCLFFLFTYLFICPYVCFFLFQRFHLLNHSEVLFKRPLMHVVCVFCKILHCSYPFQAAKRNESLLISERFLFKRIALAVETVTV